MSFCIRKEPSRITAIQYLLYAVIYSLLQRPCPSQELKLTFQKSLEKRILRVLLAWLHQQQQAVGSLTRSCLARNLQSTLANTERFLYLSDFDFWVCTFVGWFCSLAEWYRFCSSSQLPKGREWAAWRNSRMTKSWTLYLPETPMNRLMSARQVPGSNRLHEVLFCHAHHYRYCSMFCSGGELIASVNNLLSRQSQCTRWKRKSKEGKRKICHQSPISISPRGNPTRSHRRKRLRSTSFRWPQFWKPKQGGLSAFSVVLVRFESIYVIPFTGYDTKTWMLLIYYALICTQLVLFKFCLGCGLEQSLCGLAACSCSWSLWSLHLNLMSATLRCFGQAGGDHCSASLFWLRPEATTGQATQQYGSLRLLLIDLLCLRAHMQM